jgi:hypothetical protein
MLTMVRRQCFLFDATKQIGPFLLTIALSGRNGSLNEAKCEGRDNYDLRCLKYKKCSCAEGYLCLLKGANSIEMIRMIHVMSN